jgi:hypothetical protein
MNLFETYLEANGQIKSKLAKKILTYLKTYETIKEMDYTDHANDMADFIFNKENLSKIIYFILDKDAKFNKETQSRIITEEQFKSLADKITQEVTK